MELQDECGFRFYDALTGKRVRRRRLDDVYWSTDEERYERAYLGYDFVDEETGDGD